MSETRRLYLVRHGESSDQGKLLGRTDPCLSELGRSQSADVADRVRSEGVATILSSPLCRARESADILGAALGLDVVVDPDLIEVTYGEWDGLSWAEIEERFPDLVAKKTADWWGVDPPGAEPAAAFRTRLQEAAGRVRAAEAWPVMVVAHSAVNSLLAEVFAPDGFCWERTLEFRQPLGGVLAIDLK